MFTFRVTIKWKNWRTASSDLHRVLGVWAPAFHFILAFSGFYMMLYALDIKTHFGELEKPHVPPAFSFNLDEAISQAQRSIPGMQFSYINFPRQRGDYLKVSGDLPGGWLFGNYNNKVSFDLHTGHISNVFREDALSSKKRFEYALYTLHYGQYGGTGVKWLYSFFALAGAVITVTGFLLWWRKRQASNKKPSKKRLHSHTVTR